MVQAFGSIGFRVFGLGLGVLEGVGCITKVSGFWFRVDDGSGWGGARV